MLRLTLLFLVVVFVVACAPAGPSEGDVQTAIAETAVASAPTATVEVPTDTPEPTDTPKPTNTPGPTDTPTITSTPYPTPDPSALDRIIRDVDDVTDLVLYYPEINLGTDVSLYFSENSNGDPVDLTLYFYYTGDDWVFFDELIIRAGDDLYEVPVLEEPYHDVRDGGTVVESYHLDVITDNVPMIYDIARLGRGQKVIVRFSGSDGTYDHEVSIDEKRALKDVLDAFILMGGDIDNP